MKGWRLHTYVASGKAGESQGGREEGRREMCLWWRRWTRLTAPCYRIIIEAGRGGFVDAASGSGRRGDGPESRRDDFIPLVSPRLFFDLSGQIRGLLVVHVCL